MNVIIALLPDNTGIHIDYVMYTITLQGEAANHVSSCVLTLGQYGIEHSSSATWTLCVYIIL